MNRRPQIRRPPERLDGEASREAAQTGAEEERLSQTVKHHVHYLKYHVRYARARSGCDGLQCRPMVCRARCSALLLNLGLDWGVSGSGIISTLI